MNRVGGQGDTRTAFATVLHDPEARLREPLFDTAPALRQRFGGIAVSLTDTTHPSIAELLVDRFGARIGQHPTGEAVIGLGRRNAVRLALELGTERILYSDLDHLLRWVAASPEELDAVLRCQPDAALLIVGRSPRALANSPRRLRDTEVPINHIYRLLTGRDADLLFAVRRMDRAAASDLVAHAIEDTLANDVEWPLLAERLGHRIGCVQADGLAYRTLEDFGAGADALDDDPLQWVRRVEFAAEMARVLRRFLGHNQR